MVTFNSRYVGLKPKPTEELNKENARELVINMKEWRNDWEKIETTIKSIKTDCVHFDMPEPEFKNLELIESELIE